jgi:hypothetical protein
MGIVVGTIYFYFLTWLFGDNDVASRGKSFLIVLAGGIVQVVCILEFPDAIGPIGALLLATGAMVILLITWCRTSLASALKIVACFLVGTFVWELALETLSSQAQI